jgi:uridine kinase
VTINCLIILIGGPTSSGKTTLAHAVADAYEKALVVSQDTFYLDRFEQVHLTDRSDGDGDGTVHVFDDWESALAIDSRALVDCVAEASASGRYELIVVEGHLLFEWPQLVDMCHVCVNLSVEWPECRRRRCARDAWLCDNPLYFEHIVASHESRRAPPSDDRALLLNAQSNSTEQLLEKFNDFIRHHQKKKKQKKTKKKQKKDEW